MNQPSKIAVLTSGGDAPGMNAALRAAVRTISWHKKLAYRYIAVMMVLYQMTSNTSMQDQ